MASERLRAMDKKRRTDRKARNQVRVETGLTLAQAQARKDIQDNWETYRAWAMRCAWQYLRTRLGHVRQSQWEEVAEESIAEAWRDICNGVDAKTSISRAANRITESIVTHKRQSRELPELADHSPEYMESQADLLAIVASLPERLRGTALALSAGWSAGEELADMLGISRASVFSYVKQIRQRLGSRFGYLLLKEWQIEPANRLA